MHKTLKLIFEGVYDDGSYLHALLGKPHIIQLIWNIIRDSWQAHIKHPSQYTYRALNNVTGPPGTITGGEITFYRQVSPTGALEEDFPEPSNINVNMMPFIASHDFEETKLPEYIRPYASMIARTIQTAYRYKLVHQNEEEGKIYFLTIQESWVDTNTSQRRSGLHTDNPGPIAIRKPQTEDAVQSMDSFCEGHGSCDFIIAEHDWGNGVMLHNNRSHRGGIYMASNVSNSCRVWDCKIEADPNTGEETISNFGDIDHLRRFIPDEDAEVLEPNTLYWITDRTPHESLPLEKGQFRQFFRVVTSEVSLWFADDNTENPNGVKPDPSITKIVKGSKFNPSSLEFVN